MQPRSAPPATAARAEQVRATRQKVLGAARDLFLRRGYSGATIEAIAQRAAVSPQTVYNVVGGKAALLKAVYDVAAASKRSRTSGPSVRHTWRTTSPPASACVPG
jgi:AcrR family transcriptional regulator